MGGDGGKVTGAHEESGFIREANFVGAIEIDDAFIQGANGLHVLGASCFNCGHARIHQGPRILHPLSLIPGAVFHHQQVA